MKYFKVDKTIAERLNVTRQAVSENEVLISESDLRMLDLSLEEKAEYFGCKEVSNKAAKEMIKSYTKPTTQNKKGDKND